MMKRIFLLTAFALSILGVNAQSNTTDEGVVINGIKWATRNVDKFGTFAANPEDDGMLYQWNRKTAWPASGSNVSGWSSIPATGSTWEEANDPSPAGWHVPTLSEIDKLLDTDKVSYEIVTVYGGGYRFTDKASGKSIYLPSAGGRFTDGTLYSLAINGDYWSSTSFSSVNIAQGLFFCCLCSSEPCGGCGYGRECAFSIRSVADFSPSNIADIAQASELSISPSPATNLITVSGLLPAEMFYIYNINGQQLLSRKATAQTEQIIVDYLPAGIYFVRTSNGQALKWMKK
ncbi:MAG: T9SS type A sorting domain-containing protein [Candidatus Azobacteroides sp.]|nr:T9SS type A sorting domain-containing protein [Candidatus Azobacteroides sp.]